MIQTSLRGTHATAAIRVASRVHENSKGDWCYLFRSLTNAKPGRPGIRKVYSRATRTNRPPLKITSLTIPTQQNRQHAAAAATASAYATSATQFAQNFVHQGATAPPVNAQVDHQNIEKYSQYLDILRNAYGIQLPGELGQKSQPAYELSSYPTATATTYQAGASPYLTAAQTTSNTGVVQHSVQHPTATYTAATSNPQPQAQYQVYQPQPTVYEKQQQVTYQNVAQPVQSSGLYSQISYPDTKSHSTMQQIVPSMQIQQQQQIRQQIQQQIQQQIVEHAAQPTYSTPYPVPAPIPSSTAPPHSYETVSYPTYSSSLSVSQPQYPQPQSVQYPGLLPSQTSSPVHPQPAYTTQLPSHPQPSVPSPYPQPPASPTDMQSQQTDRYPPSYQTAVFSTYNGQSTPPKPQVYTYKGPDHGVKPTYSTNTGSQYISPSEQAIVDANTVAEPETIGSIYGGGDLAEPAVYPPHTQPSVPPMTRPTTPRPTSTRPRPTVPPTKPSTRLPMSTKTPEIAVSAQALTQQIRRLPAVLYLDSRMEGSAELETLLRDTYGLPLVAFYVDKLGRPQLAQKHLHQLTAHKGLPYLFICGTFIGSEQHIQNYHKNGQIPQLVEYVCGDDRKKKKNKKTSS
ncbi:hypothetical protein RB195_006663 [Necator americanus]|uniref:Glutaredoxin domain-containing protein n=1 Tax=Necator americanus TaxID=51031 RepID=A0ABR1BWL7_NECAM